MTVNENIKDGNFKKSGKSNSKIKKIGFIMPISDSQNYIKGHWGMVKGILNDIVDEVDADLDVKVEGFLVSDTNGTDSIIQRRIVNNIYSSDLIICDVSDKNPNVLFELGMRLAFDKKVIIIKDEKTNYIFDTNNIFHNDYPSDLNYTEVINFKDNLVKDIKEALEDSNQKGGFLDTFGDFKLATMPKEKAIDENEAFTKILDEISRINRNVMFLEDKILSERNYKNQKIESNYIVSKEPSSEYGLLEILKTKMLKLYPDKSYFSSSDVIEFLNKEGYKLNRASIKRLGTMLNEQLLNL